MLLWQAKPLWIHKISGPHHSEQLIWCTCWNGDQMERTSRAYESCMWAWTIVFLCTVLLFLPEITVRAIPFKKSRTPPRILFFLADAPSYILFFPWTPPHAFYIFWERPPRIFIFCFQSTPLGISNGIAFTITGAFLFQLKKLDGWLWLLIQRTATSRIYMDMP